MNKIYRKDYDETYYSETLQNGLRVLIFHKPEFSTTSCAFGTPYGALKINEKLNGKEYHFNPGVAHFLEHKLFESKGDDIMNEFSKLGANVNAFTSYKETVYFFSITNKKITKPLNLLLDFVQDLHISEESVEKEKGIIYQEVSSYEQLPDSKLFNEVLKSLYRYYPLKYDIGGDKQSIYSITNKELEECYRINYHPSNMVLMITSPVSPEKIIKIVKDNQDSKQFKKRKTPITINEKEPLEVFRKRYKFKMNVNNNRHALAYKINPDFKDVYDAYKKEWCLRILFEAHFSPINPEYQKWIDEKLINDYFGYDIDFDMDHAFIIFINEHNDSKVIKKLVKNSLKKNLLNEEILNQIKRRYIGESFNLFDDVESFNTGYIRDYLNGIDLFRSLDILKNITLKDVENSYKTISFQHESIISMVKK